MKMQTKLATAIVLSLSAMGAYAAPTLYGAMDLSIDYLPNNDATNKGDKTQVSSNSSFIGIKGEESLTENLSAVYQADWTFYADGETSDFGNRTRFIGLKDQRFGTLKVGQIDTPLKNLSSAVDSFNSRIAGAADVDGIFFGDNRISNSLVYESPKIKLGTVGTLNINGLIATGETDQAIRTVSGGAKVAGRNFGDAWSASAVYNHSNDLFLVGVGVDQAIPSRVARTSFYDWSNTGNFVAMDTLRVTGRVNLKEQGLTLKAMAQSGEVSDKRGSNPNSSDIDKSKGFLLGVEYALPNTKVLLKTQYSQNKTSYKTAGTPNYDAKQYMLGVDYSFNKNITAYAQAGYVDLKNIQGTAGDDGDQVVTGVGMLYKF